MSSRPGGDALVPMNGMAGAGLATGIFALAVAIFGGFFSVPFAVVAAIAGIFAVFFGARGRAFARAVNGSQRLAQIGQIAGALAIVLGIVGVILR